MYYSSKQPPLYIETQRLRQWWIWLIVLVAVLFVAWMFIEQIVLGQPVGNNPAPDGVMWVVTILVGVGVPLLMYSVNLTAEVDTDRLVIQYFLLWKRTILLCDISVCFPCEYRPIRDFGGWGIRCGLGKGMCYTIYGSKGVQLELANGRKVLIGAQRPEEMAAVINRARGIE